MVLISGIAIIVLVVAGVAMLLAVMQENAGIIDAGVEIDKHSNERNREDVEHDCRKQDCPGTAQQGTGD